MPIVFGVVGLILIVSGVRGTVTGSNPNLVDLVKEDFTGQPNYFEWMAAIFIIGAIGYVKEIAPISRALMIVVVLGLLFSNQGFFAKLKQQVTENPSQSSTTSGTNDVLSTSGTNDVLSTLSSLP